MSDEKEMPVRVVIESPFAGERPGAVALNVAYARAAMADALSRGEAPYASHLLYTQPGVLDDAVPLERQQGIEAGFAWWASADLIAFYVDRGWSPGMKDALIRAAEQDVPFVTRSIGAVGDLPRSNLGAFPCLGDVSPPGVKK